MRDAKSHIYDLLMTPFKFRETQGREQGNPASGTLDTANP